MKSLSNLFRYGPGPSSSHTIAPYQAACAFRKLLTCPLDKVQVIFFGSLALTGEGHHSVFAVQEGLKGYPVEVIKDRLTKPTHPLSMTFEAVQGEKVVLRRSYRSLGGGELSSDDDPSVIEKDIYPCASLKEIFAYMKSENLLQIKDFCLKFEDPSIDDYLMGILKKMFRSVEKGLSLEGPIPANSNPRLQVTRSAKGIYEQAVKLKGNKRRFMLLSAYAYAVAESSACGDLVVTSPTCGSSGVLPAILYYAHKNMKMPLTKVRDALYTAGTIGNLVKQNASIAGSVGGCQAEIGTASSMAAAALCSLFGLSNYQIEYAAEVAMEHFLGLSCDPVDGYVIIPCIERNGIAAIRALACFYYARYISPIRQNKVNFDDVVAAMKITGDSLAMEYKETALGGLAYILDPKHC